MPHSQIYEESRELHESILEKDSFECVGCNASRISIKITDISQNLKGKKVRVYEYPDGFQNEKIPIFNGIVDSVQIDGQKKWKQIRAFDELYIKGQKDVAPWYKSQSFPATLGKLRKSFMKYIELEQEDVELPNDDVVVNKEYSPENLQAQVVLQSFCQINGACGIINRNGLFEYRWLKTYEESTCPSITLFPSDKTYPKDKLATEPIYKLYETCQYEEFTVKPIGQVLIRQSDDVTGEKYGDGTNKYIIQGNMWTLNLSASTLRLMARRIYEKVHIYGYHPFKSKNPGFPWLEPGDAIAYMVKNADGVWTKQFFSIMSRSISGIQNQKDYYEARGTEEQNEFITDIKTQIDLIKKSGVKLDNYYTKDEIDRTLNDYPTIDETTDIVADQVNEMETPTGFNVVSVYTLPKTRANNTIYLIQGGVIIQ